MRRIDSIFIHYTDSPEVSLSAINYWHLLAFPENPDPHTGLFISYHHVIHQTGWVEAGRDERSVGWHVKGYNSRSIGIVLTGSDGMDWYPTSEQYASLQALLRDLMRRYSISPERIYFHRDKNATSCPGRLDKQKILRLLGEPIETPAPEPEKEEWDMGKRIYAYQSGVPRKDHYVEGLETSDDYELKLFIRDKRGKPVPQNKLKIVLHLEGGRDIQLSRFLRKNDAKEINLSVELLIKNGLGKFSLSVTSLRRWGIRYAVTAGVVLEYK